MRFVKKGRIYSADSGKDWSYSHSQVPKAMLLKDKIRVYFGTRDKNSITNTTFVELKKDNPGEVVYIHEQPVMKLGNLGAFDDRGVMPASLLRVNEKIYLYYTGWNRDYTVSYRLAIGIAESIDGGITFNRVYEGPVLDRSVKEPYSVCQPHVLFEENKWKMWYSSFTKWELIENHTEPFYNIKYAESKNGIDWELAGKVCLDYDEHADALGNPFIWKENNIYKILFSYRKNIEYRKNKIFSYKIGYAESNDGISWKNIKYNILPVSESGWDSEMIAYPNLLDVNGTKYLFYNGNGFGKTGFGYAVLEDE